MKATSLAIGLVVTCMSSSALADVPADYKGTPFDPAVAGGTCNGTPTSSVATKGPYPLPGRIYFKNHDMGGLNVGYFTTDHITFGGNCWRTDYKNGQQASLSVTTQMADNYAKTGDVWFMSGDSTLDGMFYPSATTADVYIAAVRPGDWANVTVNVQTAGTYQVSSTWADGNGNPGGEGGDGSMELQVSVNGTMMLDWKATFPNYNTTANFHNWWPVPNMGTIDLQQGLYVIKMLSSDPHLNLDYVDFELVGPDGGVISGGSGASSGGSGAASGASASGSASGSVSSGSVSSGAASTGTASSGTVAATGSTSGAATSGSSVSSGTSASAGSGGTSGTGTNPAGGSGAEV
jgi:hypothetical protein